MLLDDRIAFNLNANIYKSTSTRSVIHFVRRIATKINRQEIKILRLALQLLMMTWHIVIISEGETEEEVTMKITRMYKSQAQSQGHIRVS